MYRIVLRNKNGDLLMEDYLTHLCPFIVQELSLPGIIKDGGCVEIKWISRLQRCESEDGFI